jgi:hypothetical protein
MLQARDWPPWYGFSPCQVSQEVHLTLTTSAHIGCSTAVVLARCKAARATTVPTFLLAHNVEWRMHALLPTCTLPSTPNTCADVAQC